MHPAHHGDWDALSLSKKKRIAATERADILTPILALVALLVGVVVLDLVLTNFLASLLN
jgi:hypothetical protein